MKFFSQIPLSFCGQYVKNYRYDWFLSCCYISSLHRETLFRTFAFYLELSRALSVSSSWEISGTLAGFIRLQWWREFLEGKDRPHELGGFFQTLLSNQQIQAHDFLTIIQAFEEELEGIKDWSHWHSIMMRSHGQIFKLVAKIIGISDEIILDYIARLSVACELISISKFIYVILAQGRRPFPNGIIEQYHLERGSINDEPKIIETIREIMLNQFKIYYNDCQRTVDINRSQFPILFPSMLAMRDLKRRKNWHKIFTQRDVKDQIILFIAFIRNKMII